MKFSEKSRFILSKKVLLQQYEKLKEYANLIAYSFKTNPIVGKVLEKMTDCMFLVCSYSYVNRIKEKSRIIYSLQGEENFQIKSLLDMGITKFVVDNENDLKKLLEEGRKIGRTIDIFLRAKVREHTIYTGKYFVFGFSKEDLNRIIKELKKENFVNINIHFHRKTQNVGEWFLEEDFNEILEEENRKVVKSVDIGGGIPIEYVNSKPNINAILEKIKNFKEFLNRNGINLVIEPGRFLAAPSVMLETEIINVYGNTIVVDASLFNGAMDVYLLGYRFPVVGEVEEGKGEKFLIKGRSPDSLDIFRYKVFLREKPKIGDKIVFKNVGAYNFYTDFNNLPRIKTVIMDDFPEEYKVEERTKGS
jgi:ornithine decarboxylase